MYYTLSRETEPSEYTTHQLSIHRVYTKYRQSIHCFSREYTAVCPPVPSQNHQTVLNNMLMRSLQEPAVYPDDKNSEKSMFFWQQLSMETFSWIPVSLRSILLCWQLKMAPELFLSASQGALGGLAF